MQLMFICSWTCEFQSCKIACRGVVQSMLLVGQQCCAPIFGNAHPVYSEHLCTFSGGLQRLQPSRSCWHQTFATSMPWRRFRLQRIHDDNGTPSQVLAVGVQDRAAVSLRFLSPACSQATYVVSWGPGPNTSNARPVDVVTCLEACALVHAARNE